MTVQTKQFDTAVSSTTGDIMLAAINPAASVCAAHHQPGPERASSM